MEQDIARILISKENLDRRVGELAHQIVASYPPFEESLTIVTILSGSIIFLADLIRRMPVKMKIDLITVSSYSGRTTQSAEAKIVGELTVDVTGRDVLIIDDILDTGKTIRLVRRELDKQHPRSLKVATLLRKTAKAPADVHVDFVGFDIEDEFVVGYGLDYNGHYRNLPDIAVLTPEAM